ncbi:MAG: lactonase family protein [Prevotellaceae bacterium]|jgi:6-phosphogluconolactonase (cycloisomerase 2 family)|nr:lactonase family protein [Prevotellaceae bacterium]
MRKLLFCALCLAVAACASRKTNDGTAGDELTMLVGTYTDGSSRGIYSFRFNQATGEATALDSADIVNPSYLTTSADGRFVYAVSETEDTTAAVSAFALDAESGKFRLLNRQPACAGSPCYIATDGRVLLTANYGGGSMGVFGVERNGTVGRIDTLFEGSTGGTDAERQATPHVHCAVFSPDGKYIFATDFSADRLLRFVVHPGSNVPYLSDEHIALTPETGPRHLTFSPNGRFAYLIGELSGMVTAFSYDDGTLTPLQTITADTLHARGSADIHLSPDGRYLYASNRLQGDGVAIFAVDSETGRLAKAGYQPTGVHPRNFCITPNGAFLLVGCRDSGVIQVFRRNADTGLLTDTHRDIRIDKAVCIRFVE